MTCTQLTPNQSGQRAIWFKQTTRAASAIAAAARRDPMIHDREIFDNRLELKALRGTDSTNLTMNRIIVDKLPLPNRRDSPERRASAMAPYLV